MHYGLSRLKPSNCHADQLLYCVVNLYSIVNVHHLKSFTLYRIFFGSIDAQNAMHSLFYTYPELLVKARGLWPWIFWSIVVIGEAAVTSSQEKPNGAQDYPPYGWCSR